MNNNFELRTQAFNQINKRLGLYSISSINTTSYLDFLKELFLTFKWNDSTISQKIKIILQTTEATIDYYEEFLRETDDEEKIKALCDVIKIGFDYIVDVAGIKIPQYISIFENKIIKIFVEATYSKLKEKDIVNEIVKKVEVPTVVEGTTENA